MTTDEIGLFNNAIVEMLVANAETVAARDVWAGDEVLIINKYRGVTHYRHGFVAKISKQGGLQTAQGEFLIAPRHIHVPVTVYLLHRTAKPLPTEANALIHVTAFGSHISRSKPGLFQYNSTEKAWFTFGSAERFVPGDFREWTLVGDEEAA